MITLAERARRTMQPHQTRQRLKPLSISLLALSCAFALAAPLSTKADPIESSASPMLAPAPLLVPPTVFAPVAPVADDLQPESETRAATAPQAEPALVQPDQDAIAARDARMLDTLTAQAIEVLAGPGFDNDGETTSAERDAARAFYETRDFEPLFIQGGGWNARARTILSVLADAEAWGLAADDFTHEAFFADDETAADAMAAARADIALTLWTLRYARHAQTGRVNPASIASDITVARQFVDPATVLPTLLAYDDLYQALTDYHPPHAQFHALREELARLRETDGTVHEPIAEGGTLRLGDTDPRVPLLRERLGLDWQPPIDEPEPEDGTTAALAADGDARLILASAGTDNTGSELPLGDVQEEGASLAEETDVAPPDPNLFDEALDVAVRAFQADHNLTADGIVGPATFAALNEKAGDLTPDIIANMERWRWMPRELGDFHVLANIPEYRLWVVEEGETIFTTRTVVGTPRNRTAIFSDEMEYIAVNPYWNVPSSIARGELLPRILQDPGYLARGNYEVVAGGQIIDPYAIDWQLAAERGLPRIRQRPGARNALGEIKFMFPNSHAIYFHDTPSRGLFARDVRAYSHGCVRVQDPWAFAEALMRAEPGWSVDRLRALKGPQERSVHLDRHIPVHLTYFTARVDEDGRLIMARDIYGHHARVVRALGLGEG